MAEQGHFVSLPKALRFHLEQLAKHPPKPVPVVVTSVVLEGKEGDGDGEGGNRGTAGEARTRAA